MNANELRIGNWIQCNDLPFTVDGVAPYQGGHLVYSASVGVSIVRCKPVPLTVQWLECLGFEVEDCHYARNANIKIDKTSFDFYEHGSGGWVFTDSQSWDIFYMHDLHYVHQMQNFIFATTGHELILKKQ